MKKILVTGGAGFLGSKLCEKLLEQGDFVYCLDNLYTGKLRNIASLQENKNFKFINEDINEFDITNIKVDEIYNAACPASPPAYQEDPLYTIKTNILGIEKMLDLATLNNAKILQFSTSEIYGNPLIHPQVEEYHGNVNPIGIRACYDEGKRLAETLCFDYKRQKGTRIKIVRIFNTYGVNMDKDDGRVISNFIIQALNNEDITIYGDGNQTRSFCYVDDLITGIIKMMETEDGITGPFNLGNPEEFTIKELAEIIIKKTCSKSKVVYMNLPKDDPTKRKPDITKAKKFLNWNPTISLDKGLDKAIEYFKEILKESKICIR